MTKTICILGGGIGGVVTAVRAKKALGAAARVVVVDKSPDHVFQPSLLWILSGQRRPEDIKRPLSSLEKNGIEFVNAPVTAIDPESALVRAGDQEIKYDYLVVALGAEENMAAVDGLTDGAINLYSIDGILLLKEELGRLKGGEVVLLIPSMPYKCPAAPYEAAFLLDAELKRCRVRDKVNISIYTFEPLPMPTAGPENGRAIKAMLEGRGINFNPELTIASIDPGTKEVTWTNGETKRAGLLVTVPPHKAPDVVKAAGLTNEAGWIPVDPRTLKTKFDNVYAVGDVAAVKLEGKYKPDKPLMLPKAGVFAHAQAEVVAAEIVAAVKGDVRTHEFKGEGACFLELGDGTAGYAAGNFFALPHPQIKMKKPSRFRRLGKVLFEKYWFWRWFQ